jgi:hypothetical protein
LNIEDFLIKKSIKLKLKFLGKLRDAFDIVGKESAQWVGFMGRGEFSYFLDLKCRRY